MSSFRVMSLADLHLSGGADSDEALALNKAAQVARDNRVDYVLVNGDIFHSKSTPAQRLVFKNFLEDLEISVKAVVVLRGNHDELDDLMIYERDTVGELEVAVFQQPGVIQFNEEIRIHAIPHYNASAIAMDSNSLEQMGEEGTGHFDTLLNSIFNQVQSSNTPSMVAFHGTVTDAHLDNGMIPKHDGIVLNGPLLSSIGCPIRGGHYHAAQEPHPNVRYSGSITLRNYGESGDKGVLIDECIDGVWQECRFVSLNPAPRYTIEGNWENGQMEFYSDPRDPKYKGARIRFRYTVKQSDVARVDLDDVREIFEKTGALELKIERDLIIETAVRSESIHQATSVIDMHEEWLKLKGLDAKVPAQRELYNRVIEPVGLI